MKKKISQFKWLATTLLLVAAMVMPSVAWAYNQPNGKGTKESPYQISSGDELYWFAAYVNGDPGKENGNYTACAVLTADITVSETWTPILNYSGTFDGNGHTISGLQKTISGGGGDIGLFGTTEEGSVICNVGIVNCSFSLTGGGGSVGGVCGQNKGTIKNCYNTGTVDGTPGQVGGVCGTNNGTIKNCYNTGSVNNGQESGGVCGLNFENGTIKNCYYLSGTAKGGIADADDTPGSVEVKDATQFASGEVAWLLNGKRSEGTTGNPLAWYQDIKGDSYPVLDSRHGTVYRGYKCLELTYSNNPEGLSENPVHNYDNGICKACKAYQPATLTTDKYDIDGNDTKDEVYEIGNAGQLYWFADKVNNDNTNFGSANAILTTSITVNSSLIENLNADGTAKAGYEVRSWMPISPEVNYSGTFDGDNHTISGLYYNVTSSDEMVRAGLFGRNAGTIKNVSVKGSYFKLNFGGKYCLFGILCGFNAGTIENCYNESTITLTGKVGSHAGVGGICGDNGGNGIIKNCNNIGKVSSEASCLQPIIYVGGVSGENVGTGIIENSSNAGKVSGICNVGGVCGYNNSDTYSVTATITSCYNEGKISGDYYVGGVCGYNCSSTIESCHNTGEVIGTESVGGVCGKIRGSKITNSYNTNTGKVTGSSYVGGVCGEIEVDGGTATIENCYNARIVTGTGGVCGGIDYQYNGTVNITNNYYLSETATDDGGKTEGQFKSGEVCYLLNNGKIDGSQAWYQLLKTETYPNLDKTNSENRTVYQCNPCTAFYSNTEGITKDHNHVNDGNGFLTCTACGDKRYEQATLNESGEYEIGNAGQLYWFAGLVNGTLDGVTRNKSANAVLTNNITVNEGVLDINGNPNSGTFRNWTPIGAFEISTWTGYSGIFDGKNYTINGLYFNNTNTDFVGLFSSSNGTIKNVGVVDSYFNGLGDVGGLCGYNVNGRIENCYTTSSVNGTTYIGGVCGQNDTGGKILNCYNLGAVSGTTNVGGVRGDKAGTITNCYYLANEDDKNGGKTEAQFKSGEVAYLLNEGKAFGTQVWGQQLGVNDYPVLGSGYKVIRAARGDMDANGEYPYWATFSNQSGDSDLGDLNVYTAKVSNGILTITRCSDKIVAKGEGVLVKGSTEYLNAKMLNTTSEKAEANNDLVATPDETKIIYADSGHKLYRLTYNSGTSDLGFYLGLVQNETGDVISDDGSQLKATPNKAYLKVATADVTKPSGAAARGFVIPGDDGETTGIECISVTNESLHRNGNADGIFDLQGRKVSKPTNGLYIKNNKKILIKN